jgi:DNA-directed DNA polymerase III PolC
VYLNCHSHFSLNHGVLSPEDLVKEACSLGISRMALTDINNTSGIFDFIGFCQRAQIEGIAGVEFRNEFRLCYIALAQSPAGFARINEWFTSFLIRKEPFPAEAPVLAEVAWIYPTDNLPARPPREGEWLGIRPSELSQWQFRTRIRKELPSPWHSRTVAWQPVTFLDRKGFDLHRLLRCIEKNTLLSKLDSGSHAGLDEKFAGPEEMLHWYREAPELIFRAEMLLESCSFPFTFRQHKNKKVFSDSGDPAEDIARLRQLAADGLIFRYGEGNKTALERVRTEMEAIEKLGFTSYFLITWDIVRYAMSKGYFHVGRGSGANSIVAYCLGITDVDPIELDLYFERFINPHRASPPDFDIDFSWDEREDIQNYIFRRYKEGHVAMLGTYVTYQGNSILRELGKVFGLPKSEIDQMSDFPDEFQNTRTMQWINRFGSQMKDMPQHLSIHAGGILISEESLYNYTALHFPPKGFATTQFDMYVAEDIGLAKFDILSQRGLGHIKDAVDIIYENQGVHVDVHAIHRFKKDETIRNQIRSSETLGCFYIESPGMRQLLSKLRCEDYLTLVAASSIIRPGVAKSGMMKEYIFRFHNPGSFTYIHPAMEPLLKETFGVMVYQEDVIKVAHHFAGLSLEEADILRRGMSGKFRSRDEFQKIRDRFFNSCARKGYPEDISTEVWRQIESFSGYSFSKAHSASFAVESYQSLFLKAYYPKEFMVAVINNFGGFYRTEVYIHEARRCGAIIEAPCINTSGVLTCIRKDHIYLGFIHLKSLESKLAEAIVEERGRHGKYRDLKNLTDRVPMGLEQLVLLVRIGALRFTGQSKKELLWEAHMIHQGKKPVYGMEELFCTNAGEGYRQELSLPQLSPEHYIENAYDEIELLGFPLTSPFALSDWREESDVLINKTLETSEQNIPMAGLAKRREENAQDEMPFGRIPSVLPGAGEKATNPLVLR